MDTCSFYAVSKLYIQLPQKSKSFSVDVLFFQGMHKNKRTLLEYPGIDFETGKYTFIISLSAKCVPGKIVLKLSNKIEII